MSTTLILLCLVVAIQSVPLSEFFPYGTPANDQQLPPNDDGSTSKLSLPRIFPYFNNNHRQIYLANNGLFSFLGPISTYVPIAFPIGNDSRLIAGFWSDIDTRGNIPGGNKVYYQIYSNETSTGVFSKASQYVRDYFPGERSFNPTMVITGTWYRVGAYEQRTSATNTFQIVLATDELRSFVFLLYNQIQWAGSSTNGISGQAGFNAGDGIVFEMLPHSRTSRITELVNISNVGVAGLFVFRVDTDTITLGGCGNISNLAFQPRRGSQLGLTPITIQGPCFNNISESHIKCRFGYSTVVNGIILNEYQALCLTPFVSLPTYTNVYFSTDGGDTFNLIPHIFSYTSAEYGFTSTDDVQLRIYNQTNTIITVGQQTTFEWYLSETTINSWPKNTMRLQLQMCSVQLNQTNGGIVQDQCVTLKNNLIPVAGLQYVTAGIPSIEGTTNLGTVYFRIIAQDNSNSKVYLGLNSALFILHNTGIETTGYCQSWASAQPLPQTWNDNLLPCPLTLAQARVAGCCYGVDPLCNENNFNSSMNCQYHRGRPKYDELSAIACYQSRSTNQWNAGGECCYAQSGQLITHGLGAGTDDHYHPTIHPVQHYFNDILPYLACCLLTSSQETCSRYFDLRPPRRGSNSPSGNGGTWGDPHFTTLDGTTYTFNGFGEYTYLAIQNQSLIFNSQIRTTPIGSATVIRGFAAKSSNSQAQNMSVTVSRREMLIVRRGNETIDLDATTDDQVSTNNVLVLFYPELSFEYNRTSSILTLSWFIGVSIQITPIRISSGDLILNLGISLSGSYQHQTRGLLGSYDRNPNNDLQASNGTILGPVDSLTLEQIHRQFGQTWSIDPLDSLFYYESGDSAAYYSSQNLLYVPSFVSPEPPSSQLDATLAACNIDSHSTNRSEWTIAQQTCFYDIAISNDTTLGQASAVASEELAQITVDQRYPPEFNADLPLILTVDESSSVSIDFTATSPYTSSIIYELIQGPSSASFNNQTARFTWEEATISQSSIIVRVTAKDTQYNLLSTHELALNVLPRTISTTTVPPLSSTSPPPSSTSPPSSSTSPLPSSTSPPLSSTSPPLSSTSPPPSSTSPPSSSTSPPLSSTSPPSSSTSSTSSPPSSSSLFKLSWIFLLMNIFGTFFFYCQ